MRFFQFNLTLSFLWWRYLAASRCTNLINCLFFEFLRCLVRCLIAIGRRRMMLEGWRENEARYVFSIVVGCHQSHFGDFMFCYDWFTRKLSKAKPLVVRPNRMMHWRNGFLMWTARIHCLSHLIHLINDLLGFDIAHRFSINCIF